MDGVDHTSRPQPLSRQDERSPDGMAPVGIREWQRQHVQIQQREHDSQQRLNKEFIEGEAGQWMWRCYICITAGRERHEYELIFCRGPRSAIAKEWMRSIRKVGFQFAEFSACFWCYMPQSICQGWRTGRRDCAYRDVLLPMVAMMLYGPWAERVQPLWQQRLASHGADSQVIRFFGQATEGVQGQHNQLFTSFCWLRRICMELEQSKT
ncbi:uncharacterized protein BDW43DRAFT_317551 [Aspergillus alliaceus]|uniref:uncharacterized protein n=1 Tax=Petromyces alliaceus TaxID=209559 RepID=UPI0012A429D0|nr:uncharacterized protein BDW43DRAFT_317551 [Aspergillus alliaceus]KAB8226789.1 hypothetical protein BDW43DRAFT_317551 [Aspergillus alliaceus]